MNKAVFLDRDGTINKDVPYCASPEELCIYSEVPEGICLLKNSGFKIVVVTNQSGIARGYFTEETLKEIHNSMYHQLSQQGAVIDAVYHCPHHPDDNCDCRKPKTGMIKKAEKDFNIELEGSFMIGDSEGDILLGKNTGLTTICVKTGYGCKDNVTEPDHYCDTLYDAVNFIMKYPHGK